LRIEVNAAMEGGSVDGDGEAPLPRRWSASMGAPARAAAIEKNERRLSMPEILCEVERYGEGERNGVHNEGTELTKTNEEENRSRAENAEVAEKNPGWPDRASRGEGHTGIENTSAT
jgi:hypothetical protein